MPKSTALTNALELESGNESGKGVTIDGEIIVANSSNGEDEAGGKNNEPVATYAEIMENINKAKTSDDVDYEMSLAGHLPEDQINELAAAAEKKKATLK